MSQRRFRKRFYKDEGVWRVHDTKRNDKVVCTTDDEAKADRAIQHTLDYYAQKEREASEQ